MTDYQCNKICNCISNSCFCIFLALIMSSINTCSQNNTLRNKEIKVHINNEQIESVKK
jgi:hypothetical protein